ncbi:hypothetical protein [Hyphomicrobium denitrificans]|uniref:hypothetical protein n=1 Tax=Hyphomicrobium denitrificans TaxID=53399 RepID=UPI00022E81AC|nr:hypothetical protein [Hyphomicrobium denitrificans]
MPSPAYLTLEKVITCHRSKISEGTLRKWRAMRVGSSFIKIGKAILYPASECWGSNPTWWFAELPRSRPLEDDASIA